MHDTHTRAYSQKRIEGRIGLNYELSLQCICSLTVTNIFYSYAKLLTNSYEKKIVYSVHKYSLSKQQYCVMKMTF